MKMGKYLRRILYLSTELKGKVSRFQNLIFQNIDSDNDFG